MTTNAPDHPGTVDFNDTEIAFRSRSTAALRKAKVLFHSFNFPSLIQAGPKLLDVAYRLHLPVTPLVRLTIFDQFCGGVTINDCDRTVKGLAEYGVDSILDYSVEGLGQEADFDETQAETLRLLAKASKSDSMPLTVFKVTGIGRTALLEKASANVALNADEKAELARVEGRFMRLCADAANRHRMILVDAEETWLQPEIDRLAVQAMRQFNRDKAVVFNTLQMYCTSRRSYLTELHQLGVKEGFKPGIKLVRGAYMEKERARAKELGQKSPIQTSKAATDRDFDAALDYCIAHIDDLAVFAGSHNEQSNHHLTALMAKRGLKRDDPRVMFSQLLGMSDHLTYNLAYHGFNVSKYIPYGPVRAVIPYLVRRAEENSAIKGQAGRELQLIERELKRRTAEH